MGALSGLLLINGVDVYTEYGVFLCEDKAGETKNYSALLKPPAAKGHTAVSFREQDGEKLPKKLIGALEARDITLQFALQAPDKARFFTRYSAFIKMLRNGDDGWLRLTFPELSRTFRVYYKDCSDYRQMTDFEGEVVAKFSVKLREPKPEFE